MVFTRAWHLAVAAMTVMLVGIVLLTGETTASRLLGLGAVALFLGGWLALWRRACDGNGPALVLSAVIIVAALVGTAAAPSFATFQCLAFPLLWTLAKSLRHALVANVVAALAVGLGFVVSLGTSTDALLSTAATVGVSLAFSIALGLWITQIVTGSEERQALIQQLEATQQQLATASREAGTVAERERLARDIHDTIAQDLTGLIMLAQRARGETDAARRDSMLLQLEDGTRETLAETRALVASGAPASLDAGLSAALERIAERFTRETGIAVALESDGGSLARDAEVVALRCTQEALANARKHSGASSIAVRRTGTSLVISDNGTGFDPSAPSNGFGLAGMRERLALAGGSLSVTSGASGTVLTIELGSELARAVRP